MSEITSGDIQDFMERCPLVQISGGPRGHDIKISQNGVPMKGVQKFVLRASMSDVSVLITRQIVRLDVGVLVPVEIEEV